jgi:hypothetical protein
MSGNYHMTINQVQELVSLKFHLDEIVTAVMLSQCHKSCPYQECPREVKEGEQLRTTDQAVPPAEQRGQQA